MLAVRSRLAPDDRAGLIGNSPAFEVDALAVALHLQLLQISGEAGEISRVRHDADRLSAEEAIVPDGQQPQQHRQIALGWCRAKVLVHRVEAGEQLAEGLGPNGDHR
jgi:hypothetical protein